MVVPFGFGVSDVIELSKLVGNIVSAIHEARGAQSDSEQIVFGLASLQGALEILASVLQNAHQGSLIGSCPTHGQYGNAIVNGLGFEIHICRKILQDFCKASELEFAPGTGLHKARKALQWKYMKQRKLDQLQESLTPHIKALEILLGTAAV